MRTSQAFFIGVLWLSFLWPANEAEAEDDLTCSSQVFVEKYQNAYARTNNVLTSMQAMQSIVGDSYKVDAVLSRFINSAADGKFIKEIQSITELRKGYSINPKTLSSAKLVEFYKNVDLRPQPIASGLTDGYDRMAMLVSVAGFAANTYTAFSTGDRLAHAKSAKDAIDLSSAVALTYRGWQGLSIAFNSVAFVDYALNSFITAAYAQYDEYWWQAYRSYLDNQYPKMVTGQNSWAMLALKGDNGKAFEDRLAEFWSTEETNDGISSIAERAAHYYKVPTPFQRDALAGATDTFEKSFAARYYTETLKTTLETFFKRQAEKLKFEAEDKLAEATSALCEYITEIKSLQVEVTKLSKAGKARPFKNFVIKAARNTYSGKTLSGPVNEGDIIAFSAVIPVSENTAKGTLKWIILDPSGNPIEGASKVKDIKNATDSVLAKFRLKFSDLQSGKYSVRLTHLPTDKSIKPVSASLPFTMGSKPSVRITRIWVTDQPKNETGYDSLSPEQTPVLYVAFDMDDGLEKIRKKLVIRELSSGEVIVTSEGEKIRKNENKGQRTGMALAAGDLKPGSAYRFEASLFLPNGKNVKSYKDFEITDVTSEGALEEASTENSSPSENTDMTLCREDKKNKYLALQAAVGKAAITARAASNASYEMSKAFYHKVDRIKNATVKTFSDLSRQRSDLVEQIEDIKSKAKKQKLSQSEIDKGNRLIEKYQTLTAQRKEQSETSSAIIDFENPFFDNQKNMRCDQFSRFISQTSVGRKYNYNVQGALALCEQSRSAQTNLTTLKQEKDRAYQDYVDVKCEN